MKKNGIIYQRAFEPASRASADTQYNGTATVTSAAGIPIGDAGEIDVEVQIGALNASLTSVNYAVMLSTKATPTGAGDLTAVTGAEVTIGPSNGSSQRVINVKLSKANKPSSTEPLYLYVKRTQVGAFAALDSVSVKLFDFQTLPKLALAGAAAYSAELT